MRARGATPVDQRPGLFDQPVGPWQKRPPPLRLSPSALLRKAGYFGSKWRSWSGGASYYFAGGFATYRFSSYDVDQLGKSHGHLATVRIKDGKRRNGSTQLWLGSGSSLQEKEVLLTDRRGKFRSVALQRVQPLKGPLSLNISVGRSWYDIDAAKYQGTKITVGLALSDWKLLR